MVSTSNSLDQHLQVQDLLEELNDKHRLNLRNLRLVEIKSGFKKTKKNQTKSTHNGDGVEDALDSGLGLDLEGSLSGSEVNSKGGAWKRLEPKDDWDDEQDPTFCLEQRSNSVSDSSSPDSDIDGYPELKTSERIREILIAQLRAATKGQISQTSRLDMASKTTSSKMNV